MRWVCSFCLKKHFRLHVVLSWFTKRFQMPGTFEKNLLSKLSICLCLSIIPISTRPQVASSPDGELQTASNQVARSIHSKDLIRWLIASVNCEGTSLEYILLHKGFLILIPMHETPFSELLDLWNLMFEGTGLAVATIGAMGSSVVTGMMLARLVGDLLECHSYLETWRCWPGWWPDNSFLQIWSLNDSHLNVI